MYPNGERDSRGRKVSHGQEDEERPEKTDERSPLIRDTSQEYEDYTHTSIPIVDDCNSVNTAVAGSTDGSSPSSSSGSSIANTSTMKKTSPVGTVKDMLWKFITRA